ncbi:10823_t:CDS:2, partial [Racocetra fulgida]
PPHSFTPHIKIIHVPNLKTVYAICKWCEQKHDKTYAIENTQYAVGKDKYDRLIQITESSKNSTSKASKAELFNELSENYTSNITEWSEILKTWVSIVEDKKNSNKLYDNDNDDNDLDMMANNSSTD